MSPVSSYFAMANLSTAIHHRLPHDPTDIIGEIKPFAKSLIAVAKDGCFLRKP